MKTPYLDRRTTAAVKAVALILMFLHHFFTFPEYYISGISYPSIVPLIRFLRTPTRICVAVFAFLTGYFYHYARSQTLRYSLRKIKDLLIPYWVVYGLLLLLAMGLGTWQFSVTAFAGGLFGLDASIMIFCWYVTFYILAMLILPMLVKLSSGTLAGDCLLLLILPVVVFGIMLETLRAEFGVESGSLVDVLKALEEWLPCIISGYLCARYALFEGYFDGVLRRIRSGWGRMLLCLGICAAAFFGRLLCPRLTPGSISVAGDWVKLVFSMDIFYAPMFVFGASNLLRNIRISPATKTLEAVGNRSMLMWFLHCVFFNCSREYTQPVLYFLKNPLLVFLFGLGICYLAAVLIDWPLKKLLKRKKLAV